jgi:hypothetical protein
MAISNNLSRSGSKPDISQSNQTRLLSFLASSGMSVEAEVVWVIMRSLSLKRTQIKRNQAKYQLARTA